MSVAPWREVTSMEEVLPRLAELVAACSRGERAEEFQLHPPAPASAMRAADRRLDPPLPPELQAFYSVCGGVGAQDKLDENALDHVIYGVRDVEWGDRDGLFDLECLVEEGELEPEWLETPLLVFGGSIYGSAIAYCESPPRGRPGCVVLIHHDPGDLEFLADSLPQWLARFIACGCREYAMYPAALIELDRPLETAFVRDHLRLNPECAWALERLARIEVEAAGRDDAHLWWDEDERRLRPFAELGDRGSIELTQMRSKHFRFDPQAGTFQRVTHLDLSYSRVETIEGVAHFPQLETLQLSQCPVRDFSPLAKLRNLSKLHLSEGMMTDAQIAELKKGRKRLRVFVT